MSDIPEVQRVEAQPFLYKNSKARRETGLSDAELQHLIEEANAKIIEDDMALANKPNFVLVRLYDKEDNLLFVTKSPQLQQLMMRLWSAEIHHAIFIWYQERADQEEAKFLAIRNEKPKYNQHNS